PRRALARDLVCPAKGTPAPARRPSTGAERIGSFFAPAAPAPIAAAPATRVLTLPGFANATAIWVSSGRDLQGKIWLGVSADTERMRAHLIQYHPHAHTITEP